jgi:DNA-binding NtrC family response regulator
MNAIEEQFNDAGPRVWPPAARTLIDAPRAAPRVLLIDHDGIAALALAVLLTPEAQVTHVTTVAAARAKLRQVTYAVVIIDPQYIEGDVAGLLSMLIATPLLVYSAQEPSWREYADDFLPKPWTSPRKLWSSVAHALGMPSPVFIGA